jgi:thioredoxin
VPEEDASINKLKKRLTMRRDLVLLSLGLVFLFSNCNAGNTIKTPDNNSTAGSGSVIVLTNEIFKQKIFNYDVNEQWKFEGDLPVIIDFYADWCGPCKQLSPRIEEIAKEYAGKIRVYKVNTDVEQLLAQHIGIRSLPTLLFIPVKGKPQATMGAISKETLVNAIQEVLLVK